MSPRRSGADRRWRRSQPRTPHEVGGEQAVSAANVPAVKDEVRKTGEHKSQQQENEDLPSRAAHGPSILITADVIIRQYAPWFLMLVRNRARRYGGALPFWRPRPG